MEEILEITFHFAETLDRLGIEYLVGGSLASSLHGIPRATQDVDIVASIKAEHVQPLVAALHESFYIDDDMIRAAISHGSSFNIIHLNTMFKIDVFITKDDPMSVQEMKRRLSFIVSESPRRELFVASPEDIILQKLHWYRLGSGISERQYHDVLGVMKVRGRDLDFGYLEYGANNMGITDLLEEVCKDAALKPDDDPDY